MDNKAIKEVPGFDCPFYRGQVEGVALCEFDEMRPCILEVGRSYCDEYREVLAERDDE